MRLLSFFFTLVIEKKEIKAAMRLVWERMKLVIEPSGKTNQM